MSNKTEKKSYDKKLAYNNAYNRQNYRSFSVRFNKNEEKNIIEWLENKHEIKEYITSLIKKDMQQATEEQ